MNNINYINKQIIIKDYVDRGNKVLYLILRKNTNTKEVIEELMKKLKENMDIFISNIYPKIKDK